MAFGTTRAFSLTTGIGETKQLIFSFSNPFFQDPNGGRINLGKWVFFNSVAGPGVSDGTLFDSGNDYTGYSQAESNTATFAVRIYSTAFQTYNPNRTGTLALIRPAVGTFDLILPNITIPSGTYRDFYIGSYVSEEFNVFAKFHLFTATTLGSRISEYMSHDFSDTVDTSDSIPIGYTKIEFDTIPIREFFSTNPRIYPVEKIPVVDIIDYVTQRHGTITDWHFMPDYRIMFQGTNESGTYGTTNWHANIKSYGRISKSIKHWTGDFEIGNWNPQLADPENELYGSLYATVAESRYKEIQLSAMIADKPLTFIPQFGGAIEETTWQDGITSWTIKDKIKDFPNRTFIFDYENLGTIQNNGRQIGIVKRIFGTDVMFDDDGDINYIQVKSGGKAYFSIGNTISDAASGFIAGGWGGAAVNAGLGFVKGLFGGRNEIVSGYWQLTDFNIIPDGVIKSGAKIKFYGGSISGIATNSSNPLFSVKEYSIVSGTFRNTIFGFNGTVALDDASKVNIGDYLYIRKPMLFAGSPNEIIKALLCGSNIDIPYNSGTSFGVSGNFGSLVPTPINDFATNFDSELNSMNLFRLSKFLSPEFETTPFDELKELVRELQISFYIDETNHFAVRAIKPRNLISSGTEIHYREGINILDGFQWNRSTIDALVGVRVYYGYSGDGKGAFLNSYNSLYESKSKNPIVGANQWETIESKWIGLEEDARVIAYRTLVNQEHGLDRISIPTTLYGIIHSITDAIRVTHRTGSLGTQLFELESYEKDYDNSKVNLQAVNLSRSYGYGNCIWVGTSINVSNATQSGWSVMGFATLMATRHATLIGTLRAFDEIMSIDSFPLSDLGILGNSTLNHYIAFGSNADSYTEICHLIGFDGNSEVYGFRVKRGLFNTIPRTYFPTDYIYDLGPVQLDNNGDYIPFGASGRGTYVFGTSQGIGSNIGTAFRFF